MVLSNICVSFYFGQLKCIITRGILNRNYNLMLRKQILSDKRVTRYSMDSSLYKQNVKTIIPFSHTFPHISEKIPINSYRNWLISNKQYTRNNNFDWCFVFTFWMNTFTYISTAPDWRKKEQSRRFGQIFLYSPIEKPVFFHWKMIFSQKCSFSERTYDYFSTDSIHSSLTSSYNFVFARNHDNWKKNDVHASHNVPQY